MAYRTNMQFQSLPRRCRAVLVGLAGLAMMAAWTAAATAQPNRIEGVSIVSESAGAVTFEIIYAYAGDQGGDVAMSVAVTRNGERLAHYGVRPGPVRRGRHRTHVAVSALDRAPDLLSSDQVEFSMFVAGGAPFLSRTYAFAKTWSRPRAGLTAVPATAAVPQIVGNIAVQIARPQIGELQTLPAAGPPAPSFMPSGGAAERRRVLDDGSIEITYPDGTVRVRTSGSETVIHPDGSQQVFMYQNAQPPSPPSAPPDAAHAQWVTAELDSLLGVIGTLVGNDQASIDHYLTQEGTGLSPYLKINLRTRTIDMLVRP